MADAPRSLNLRRMMKPAKPQIKMKMAEKLAMKTVGTTKIRARPTTKKVMLRETSRPRKRQVVKETRRVTAAKARKRTRGMPVNAAWVVRKAAILGFRLA